MATIAASNRIPKICQAVYINGKRRSDVFCLAWNSQHGVQGTTADFTIPRFVWDREKAFLKGADVYVTAWHEGDRPQGVFAGMIGTRDSQISVGGHNVTFQAQSLISLSENVYIGQRTPANGMVVCYPRYALRNGVRTATGWTVQTILRDWFNASVRTWRGGGGSLPNGWLQKLRLGSLSGITRALKHRPVPDMTFQRSTLSDALAQLLEQIPGFNFYERFDTRGRTFLEFFERGRGPVRTVRVARLGENIVTNGINVARIDESENIEGIATRVIAYGAPRRYLISVTSDHASAPLEKVWDTSLEASVLADPESGKKGQASGGDAVRSEFKEKKAAVFRLWRLPAVLRKYLAERQLNVDPESGKSLDLQVFKWPRIVAAVAGGVGGIDYNSTLSATPILLEGWKYDPALGTILLKDPAINFVQSGWNNTENRSEITFEAAKIGITLMIQGEPIYWDTGADGGIEFPDLEDEGLVQAPQNTSYRWDQATNIGYALEDDDGNDITYGETWYYDAGSNEGEYDDTWQYWSTATVLRDNTEDLRLEAEALLKDLNKERRNWSLEIPWFTMGYPIGALVRPVGKDNHTYSTDQIRAVSGVLYGAARTVVSTDNEAPLFENEVRP